MIIDNCVG